MSTRRERERVRERVRERRRGRERDGGCWQLLRVLWIMRLCHVCFAAT